jgi:uncharacterized ubiquitin-like protein YukD
MAYADSAIDFNWTVQRIDLSQGSMTVQFDPADSADSSRPSVFRNIPLATSEFNDSSILEKVKIASKSVVEQWDKSIEANSYYPSFNADSYVGVVNSARFKPDIQGITDTITNKWRYKLVPVESEHNDFIRTTDKAVLMSDSERADYRNAYPLEKERLWYRLDETGFLDEAVTQYELNDSYASFTSTEYNFLHNLNFSVGDSVTDTIKTIISIPDDSDFIEWYHNFDSGWL